MRIKGNSPKFLSAELLIEPIGVMQPTQVSDGEGGYTVTYANVGTIWGALRSIGARPHFNCSGDKLYGFGKGIHPLPPHH